MLHKRKLRSKMELAGVTQKELAEALSVSENTISAKLNGKSRLYLDEIEKLCSFLGITSDFEKAEIFLSRTSQ